jgi:hypothetical protein
MGNTASKSALLDALFSPVEQRVLTLLFGQPRRRFRSGELMDLIQAGTGGVHRILTRLADAGMLKVSWTSNHKYYQASDTSPIFAELCSIVAKTTGLVEPIQRALQPFARRVRAAFLYGAVGRKLESGGGEIDVVIISDKLDPENLTIAFAPLSKSIGRPVVPVLFSMREWETYRDRSGTEVGKIASQSRLFLVGSENDLEL